MKRSNPAVNNLCLTNFIAVTLFKLFVFGMFLTSCISKKEKFIKDIEKAIYYKDEENYLSALKFVNTAISHDATKSFAYVLKGQIESSIENDSMAITSFTTAIKLNPRNVSAYFYKALSFSLLDQEDSAIANFNIAINLKQIPGKFYFEEINNTHLSLEDQIDVPVYRIKYFKGLSLFNMSQFQEALKEFTYSLNNGYKVSNSQYYMGIINARMGIKSVACFYLNLARETGNIDADKALNEYCK